MSQSPSPGILYIISTPIGNLADITFRAVEVLKSVSVIAAEDTRNTGILLKHYSIETPLTSLHDHNERAKTSALIHRLNAGENIALVSDAGTPGLSDPGYYFIREVIREGIKTEAVPGASALLTALVPSGLPMDRFFFQGFLPQKKGRKKKLEELKDLPVTLVFYESPFRINKLVEECLTVFGNRKAVLTRELTKKFESWYRGTLSELQTITSNQSLKGEMVLIVAGSGDETDILTDDE